MKNPITKVLTRLAGATSFGAFAMRHVHMLFWIGALSLLLTLGGCKDPSTDPKEYDRAALTANLAHHVIVPAYGQLVAQATQLETATTTFRANPQATHLDTLQASFLQAWLAWKGCSALEFGPASSVSLRTALNTFPCDTAQVHTNFTTGTWDLSLAVNIDARGFPALDFMLHGLGQDNAALLARYQRPGDSSKLFSYLDALVDDIAQQVHVVATQWNSSYVATFKESLGTDVGSSTSLLVNELNRDLEIIKTASLGIPLGKQSFDTPLPEKVEGLYGGMSKTLMQTELTSLETLFEGQATGGTDRYGLREALDAVEAQYNGRNLGDAIHDQFSLAKAALAALPEPLSEAVVSNRPPVEAAYTEVQKLVVLLKTDMASALSILITYTDADGD